MAFSVVCRVRSAARGPATRHACRELLHQSSSPASSQRKVHKRSARVSPFPVAVTKGQDFPCVPENRTGVSERDLGPLPFYIEKASNSAKRSPEDSPVLEDAITDSRVGRALAQIPAM